MPKKVEVNAKKGEQFLLMDPKGNVNQGGPKMSNPKTWGSVKSKQQQQHNPYADIILQLVEQLATQSKKGIEIKRS